MSNYPLLPPRPSLHLPTLFLASGVLAGPTLGSRMGSPHSSTPHIFLGGGRSTAARTAGAALRLPARSAMQRRAINSSLGAPNNHSETLVPRKARHICDTCHGQHDLSGRCSRQRECKLGRRHVCGGPGSCRNRARMCRSRRRRRAPVRACGRPCVRCSKCIHLNRHRAGNPWNSRELPAQRVQEVAAELRRKVARDRVACVEPADLAAEPSTQPSVQKEHRRAPRRRVGALLRPGRRPGSRLKHHNEPRR